MQLNAILQRLHRRMSHSHRRVIPLAQRGVVIGCRDCHLDDLSLSKWWKRGIEGEMDDEDESLVEVRSHYAAESGFWC